jgi:(2Fe-2S) ferredoxin
VLLARGGYGDWPEQELAAMLATVRATGRYAHVEGAFIDSGSPALPPTLRALGARGARRVVIAPVFVPVDRSLGQWLPKVVRRALKKYHLDGMQVVLAGPLGAHPATGDAVVQTLADAEYGPDVRQDAPRDVADRWLKPPAHAYHAFVCEGPRCATLGSHELFVHLRERLTARGLSASGNDAGQGVLAVRTSCLYPCNLGPLMVVYPDECWYGALSETAIDQIVDEHFGAGRPVEARRRFKPEAGARDGVGDGVGPGG